MLVKDASPSFFWTRPYNYYYYKCQDLSDAIITVAGTLQNLPILMSHDSCLNDSILHLLLVTEPTRYAYCWMFWATGSTSAAGGSTQPPSAANTDVSGTQQESSQASASTTSASTLMNSTTNIATPTSAAGEQNNIIYSYVVNNVVLRFPSSASASI